MKNSTFLKFQKQFESNRIAFRRRHKKRLGNRSVFDRFDRHGCLSVSSSIPCICNRTPKMDARRWEKVGDPGLEVVFENVTKRSYARARFLPADRRERVARKMSLDALLPSHTLISFLLIFLLSFSIHEIISIVFVIQNFRENQRCEENMF